MFLSKTYFKKGILLSATLLALIIFSTCKKYPEGGFLKRGPKIFIKNSWTLTLYEVNGIDSTNLINYNGDENYKGFIPMRDGSNIIGTLYPTFYHSIQFSDNNRNIRFNTELYDSTKVCILNSSHYSGCYRMIFNPEGRPTNWEVLKLNNKEMILTCTLNKRYTLKFKCK